MNKHRLRILHTGDLHLDSPFSSLSFEESERCIALQRDAFRRMIDYAVSKEADLFLVAGDLFDSAFVTPSTVSLLREGFASLPCPVLIAPGNHDPYTADSVYASGKLPPNVTVFSSEELTCLSFSTLPVDVYGYAFLSKALRNSPLSALPDNACAGDKTRFSLLLAHADLENPLSPYAPLSLSDLDRVGIGYAALGHVHNTKDEPFRLGRTTAAYCGFPEGRSFDECGYGKFRFLTVEWEDDAPPALHIETVRAASHRYMVDSLPVTGCENDTELLGFVRSFLREKGYRQDTALRLFLTGEVSPGYTVSCDKLADLILSGRADAGEADSLPSSLSLIDRTLPVYGAAYLEKDLSIRGELYRILKPKMLTGTPEERAAAATALRLGFAALDGRSLFGQSAERTENTCI